MTALSADAAWQLPGMRRIGPFVGRWPMRMTVIRSPSLRVPARLPRGLEPVLYDNPLAALLALSDDRPAFVVVPTDAESVSPVAVIEALTACTAVPVAVASSASAELLDVAGRGLAAGASAFISLPLEARDLGDLMGRFGGSHSLIDGDGDVVQVGGLRVDGRAFRVFLDEIPISVPPREFDLLHFLVDQHPRVVPTGELADRWTGGNAESVRVLVLRLRKRLAQVRPAPLPPVVETVRRRGYRLDASV